MTEPYSSDSAASDREERRDGIGLGSLSAGVLASLLDHPEARAEFFQREAREARSRLVRRPRTPGGWTALSPPPPGETARNPRSPIRTPSTCRVGCAVPSASIRSPGWRERSGSASSSRPCSAGEEMAAVGPSGDRCCWARSASSATERSPFPCRPWAACSKRN
jgi:hypothetical protein